MNTLRLLPLACLLWAGMAHAQSPVDCPTLPAESGLAWDKLDSADFTFCKAIRGSDARQVFAVMIAEDSPFKDLDHVIETDLMGSYRRALGWGKGRTLGARLAIQPEMP